MTNPHCCYHFCLLKLYQTTKFQTGPKAYADDKINVTEKLKFVLERAENIVGKGENASYQHFLLFPQCFQKASYTGFLKVGSKWERVNNIPDCGEIIRFSQSEIKFP